MAERCSGGRATLKIRADYFDIVRSILRYFKAYDLKARITIHSDIPVQAGLAGSTAVLASTLAAVTAFWVLNFTNII